MNKVELIGRLTKDPRISYYTGANGEQQAIASFNLAVDRRFKKEGEQSADYIGCKAFGNNANFVSNYLKQGTKIALVGHIQTGNYTNKDGIKVYTTDVVIDEIEFCESKSHSTAENTYPSDDLPPVGTGEQPTDMPTPPKSTAANFMDIPADINDDLPFR